MSATLVCNRFNLGDVIRDAKRKAESTGYRITVFRLPDGSYRATSAALPLPAEPLFAIDAAGNLVLVPKERT